jgi:hypothetical protein
MNDLTWRLVRFGGAASKVKSAELSPAPTQ